MFWCQHDIQSDRGQGGRDGGEPFNRWPERGGLAEGAGPGLQCCIFLLVVLKLETQWQDKHCPSCPLSTMIAHLRYHHYSENILQALEIRTELEIEIFGSDNVRTDSSSLWLLSPLVRSVLASLRNIQENTEKQGNYRVYRVWLYNLLSLPALLIRNHKVGRSIFKFLYLNTVINRTSLLSILENIEFLQWSTNSKENFNLQ